MNRNQTLDEQRVEAQDAEVTERQCQHHWVLEAPSGPLSTGYCRRCGGIKQFPNSAESFAWEDRGATSDILGSKGISILTSGDAD